MRETMLKVDEKRDTSLVMKTIATADVCPLLRQN